MRLLYIVATACISAILSGQDFYFGSDLSYANMMEDCGAEFKENGVPKDVYQIFSEHGFNLMRVRMWYEPTWQHTLVQPSGVKDQYNDFQDVREAIQRAKNAGMHVMLGFQLSNFWADPGKQIIPPAWVDVAGNVDALQDSVYNYVTKVLLDLDRDSLMPEIVKIGNENNGGILRHTLLTDNYGASGSISSDWSRHAKLFNSAIRAVRDVSAGTSIKPKISLHYAGTNSLSWWYQNIINNGVTDFDIIGFSYYYAWHGGSISNLGNVIKSMKAGFPGYEVMVVETGYLWTTMNYDNLGNIITTPDPQYLPVLPEKQLEYMVDMTREVMNAGGSGIVFWEPAWVSTPCRTPWGQGSSQEHVAFFDIADHNFMSAGAGTWPESEYFSDLTTKKITFKVDMTGHDVSEGVWITGMFTGDPWKILKMTAEGNNIYSYATTMQPGDSGAYYFMNDDVWGERETIPAECAPWWGVDRDYKIGNKDTTYAFIWGTCLNIDEHINKLLTDPIQEQKIVVHPNPCNDYINLIFSQIHENSYVEIMDCTGRLCYRLKIRNSRTTVDVSSFQSGLYLIRYSEDNLSCCEKIIVN